MRTVNELNQEELEELRDRLYHQLLDDGSIDEIIGKSVEYSTDIPMHFVQEYYNDTFFVEEDFWCNLNK